MEIKNRIIIDSMTSEGNCSILEQTYIEYGDQEIILENHREALVPTQANRAREILPDNLYQMLMVFWTEEIVNAWIKSQAAQEAHI